MQAFRLQVRPATRIGLALVAALLIAPTIASAGEQRTVVEEILDILKARGQISDQEYKELNARARQEEAARKKAVAPAVAPAAVAPRKGAAPQKAVAPAPAPAPATQKAAAEATTEKKVVDANANPSGDDAVFKAYWKEGLRFENASGNFKMRIGGRLQLDGAIFEPSHNLQNEFGFDNFESGVEFRRARLYAEGIIYKDFGWIFEYDFADQAFKNVYFNVKDVPGVEELFIGHYKEPMSLEELTSDNFTTFMERGLPNAFSPSRKTGVGNMWHWFDDKVTWAMGAFRGDTNDLGKSFGGEQAWDITTRLTATPWYEDDGHLFYAGLGYSHQFRSNFGKSYASRPEAHLVPNLINTMEFDTNGVDLLDPAVALVLGPFSAQAEYIQTFVQQPDLPDPRFFGWYAFVSFFLTGEHRGWKPEEAAFSRVIPNDNFGFASADGWGALEVALRQSQLNLNSAGINGGRLNDTTAGITWYLNPNMRVMANYVYANRTPVSSANVYECRFQVDY